MLRDMDLARDILIQMESSNKTGGWVSKDFLNKSKEEISYHLNLLFQASLIKTEAVTNSNSIDWNAKSITWQGYEFLDAARNQSDWEKAKQYISLQGFSITFESLKIVLSTYFKRTVL